MCQGVFPSAFNSSCDCSRSDYYYSSCNHKPAVDEASNHRGAVRARDDRGGKPAITINPRLTSYLSTAASGVPSTPSSADRRRGTASTIDGRQPQQCMATGKQEGCGISAASRMVAASSSLAMLGSKWGEMMSRNNGLDDGRESSTPKNKEDTPHFIHAFFFDST